jgi:hypothetical protein
MIISLSTAQMGLQAPHLHPQEQHWDLDPQKAPPSKELCITIRIYQRPCVAKSPIF